MAEYLVALDQDQEVRRQCEMLMTVSISRFFRDLKLWQVLQKELLPELIKTGDRKIKIWSAGCANGEEVYSFRIVWDRLKDRLTNLPQLEILATDVNPDYLNRAMEGIYSQSSLRETPEEYRSIYFETHKGRNRYSVKNSLKKGIEWKTHHLESDPPGSGFHIIFLRNSLLTYYQEEIKRKVFPKIHKSLALFGLLIIGSHERLPDGPEDLTPIARCPCILKKRAGTLHPVRQQVKTVPICGKENLFDHGG